MWLIFLTNLSLLLMLFNQHAMAQVSPRQLPLNQLEEVSRKLSGAFSGRTAGSPKALGEDFEFEISSFYYDLNENDLRDIDPDLSNSFTDTILSFGKGLYWNIDVSVSTALPFSEDLISGFSFNVEHTSKAGSWIVKPNLYISQYNLEDRLNLEASGLSLIFYRKIKSLYLGVGGNIESFSADYNENFLSSPLQPNQTASLDLIETALIAKLTTYIGSLRLSGAYIFRDPENFFYNLSIGKRF